MNALETVQPPSGGCVLKRRSLSFLGVNPSAATFGWLCVETEVLKMQGVEIEVQPPSGGCVLKLRPRYPIPLVIRSSHLRVAVC